MKLGRRLWVETAGGASVDEAWRQITGEDLVLERSTEYSLDPDTNIKHHRMPNGMIVEVSESVWDAIYGPPADDYHARKFDAGKARWDLAQWRVLAAYVDVLTYGARKYAGWSWAQVPDARERYFAALMRHLAAWRAGERVDAESGLHHLAHALCNAAFLLGLEIGDTAPPDPGGASTSPTT